MGTYLHHYTELSAYTDERENNYYEPWVSYTEDVADAVNEFVAYNKTRQEILREKYLTFNILTDGVVTFTTTDSSYTKTIEYRKNGGSWTSIQSSMEGTDISVVSGDTIEFRGDSLGYANSASRYNCFSGTTAQFNLEGNIMSLLSSTNFKEMSAITAGGAFLNFFKNTPVVSVTDLQLPAKQLAGSVYSQMFKECEELIDTPEELPATEIGNQTYYEMFSFCHKLTTTFKTLPVEVIPNTGCGQMFYQCSSLLKAPNLKAKRIGDSGCKSMFGSCSSMTEGPISMPVEYIGDSGCCAMFANCTNMVTGPAQVGKANTVYSGIGQCMIMFLNCSSLVKAPELPATAISDYCYYYMFQLNTSMLSGNTILPAPILAPHCYESMYIRCYGIRRAPVLPALSLDQPYCYDNMFRECNVLAKVKCLATSITGTRAINNFLGYNQVSNGLFIKHPDMNDWPRSTSGIPPGWTVIDAVL